MVAIHQVLPVLAPRDAIGNHTIAVRRVLHEMGITSEIFAGEVHPGTGNGARTIRKVNPAKLAAVEPTVWVYHASTGSMVAEWWAEVPGAKAIDYHNISPAELIGPWEPHVGVELDHGRRQLADAAEITDWALADSAYNEGELRSLGYRWTAVAPILLDPHVFAETVDVEALARLEARKAAGGAEFLFVSRLLPHKAQHSLINALLAYRLAYDPDARLTLIGAVGSGRYVEALNDYLEDLDLTDAVSLPGSVSAGTLGAHFRVADVYLSASDHEGFGVPLLEAMAHDVPVVAYAAAAVPETVGNAALLVADKSPATMAAAARRVVLDEALRAQLVAAGRVRVAEVGERASVPRWRDAVQHIVRGVTAGAPA